MFVPRHVVVRAFSVLLLTPLLFACGGDGSGPVTASSMTAPGGTSLTGTVGQSVPVQVVVTGSNGKAFAGGLVSFSVTAGGGSVSPSQANTDPTGKVSATWTLGTTAGTQGLRASTEGASLQFSAAAQAASPATVEAVTSFPGRFPPDQPLDQQATFVVRDQYNNPVPQVSVTFQASHGGAAEPAQGTTGSDGRVSTTWTLGPVNGVQTLTATVSGVNPASVSAEAFDACGDWQPHTVGTTSTGTITSSSCEISFQNQSRFADLYTFTLGSSGGYEFTIRSDFTDPLFLLLDPGAVAGRQEVLSDSVKVKALLDDDGSSKQYWVYVSGGPGGVGDYSFSSGSISPAMTECDVWVATKNITSTQALGLSDCYWEGPKYADLVEIWLDEGETLLAEMTSPNTDVVDPFIDLMWRDAGGVYNVIDSDDDGGEGWNARLEHTLTAQDGGSGFYVLGFSSSVANQIGAYTLTITSQGGAAGTSESGIINMQPTTSSPGRDGQDLGPRKGPEGVRKK